MTITGSLVISLIQRKYFDKNMKKLILMVLVLLSISFCICNILLPSPLDKVDDHFLLINDIENKTIKVSVMLFVGALIGLFEGSGAPLYFEFAAELSFPINESNSAVFITLVENATIFVFVGLASWFGTYYAFFVAFVVAVVAIFLLAFVKEEYKRSRQ